MRKLLFVFVSLLSITGIKAENKLVLVITETTLEWNEYAERRVLVDDNTNTVYFAFRDTSSSISITPDISKVAPDKKKERKQLLNKLLYANKKIFNKAYSGFDGKLYAESGEMVDDAKGNFLSQSTIIISPDILPVTVTHNDREWTWDKFDKNNAQVCTYLRKYAIAYESPETQIDSIEATDLAKWTYKIPSEISDNQAWEVESKTYLLNGINIVPSDGKILIAKLSEDDITSIEKKGHTKLVRKVELKHDYFSHEFEEVLAELVIKPKQWAIIKTLVKVAMIAVIVAAIIAVIVGFSRKRHKKSDSDDIPTPPAPPAPPTPPTPPTPPIPEEEIQKMKEEISSLKTQLKTNESTISTLEKDKKELSSKLSSALKDKKSLNEDLENYKEKLKKLQGENAGNKATIESKDQVIRHHLQKIKTLENKLASISRQNMYIFQIDDVLKEVSQDILKAVERVEDEELRKNLVTPTLNGVPGLDEGLTTYYKRWQDTVMNVQRSFFGKDLYEMSNTEVKAKLVSGFLKNLAQGDTFSKLTRLYMYIQADWINEILIRNGFDVDRIEQIFGRLNLLFNDFGIEIIFPRLFVDNLNDQLHTFDPRCDVFKFFPITEGMRQSYVSQTDLIVDVIQIGIRIPAENYVRKAIVSIPNF